MKANQAVAMDVFPDRDEGKWEHHRRGRVQVASRVHGAPKKTSALDVRSGRRRRAPRFLKRCLGGGRRTRKVKEVKELDSVNQKPNSATTMLDSTNTDGTWNRAARQVANSIQYVHDQSGSGFVPAARQYQGLLTGWLPLGQK